MRLLFLNDSPFVQLGLASGFVQDGHDVTFAPRHLWELDEHEQLREVTRWAGSLEPAPLLIFEGLTGGRGISHAAIDQLKAEWDAQFHYWAIEDPLYSHEVLAADGRPTDYALAADHLFSTAEECVARYRDAGLASSVLRFACNPRFHRPESAEADLECEVVLVANSYPTRAGSQLVELVMPAVTLCHVRRLRCRIFGRWWDTQRGVWPDLSPLRSVLQGPLPYRELPRVYASARIALGTEQCLNASATQSSSRIFEVLGCGRCYVGPRHRAHAALFADRVHACYSEAAEETRELLMWLLADDAAREGIAAEGRRECLARHTYVHRAREIIGVFHATSRRRGRAGR